MGALILPQRSVVVPDNFNGTTAILQFAPDRRVNVEANTPISIFAQVYLRGTGGGGLGYIYTDSTAALTEGIRLLYSAGTFSCTLVMSSGSKATNTTGNIATGNFYTVATAHDLSANGGSAIYTGANGAPLTPNVGVPANGGGTVIASNNAPTLGNRPGAARGWDGDIFELAIFKRVVTLAEFLQMQYAGVQSVPGCTFFYANGRDQMLGRAPNVRTALARGLAREYVAPLRGPRKFWIVPTPSAPGTYNVTVAEGSATAADTTNATVTGAGNNYNVAVAEGAATASDAPSATLTANVSVGEGVPRNALFYSDALDQTSVWTQSSITVSADVAADPFGVVNADKLVPSTATSAQHRITQFAQGIVPKGVAMYGSVYAKAAGYNWLGLGLQDRSGNLTVASFDVLNGVASNFGGGAGTGTGTITDAGNGWWRCSFSIASTGLGGFDTSVQMRLYAFPANSLAAYAGDGTSGIIIADAQREYGALTAYVPVPATAPTGSFDTVDATLGGGNVFNDGVAEGSATALDTPAAQSALNATVAEGSATALDTVDATTGPATYAVSVVEGGATAIDTVDAILISGAAGNYGGVWMYGLTHWKRLRGELEEEPEPEVLDTVAAVVNRTPEPEQDIAGRLLLRLEIEARGRAWQQNYLDTLEAYRAGFRDYLDELRAQERARREAMAREQMLLLQSVEIARAEAAAQLLKRRRLAAFLLLDA